MTPLHIYEKKCEQCVISGNIDRDVVERRVRLCRDQFHNTLKH